MPRLRFVPYRQGSKSAKALAGAVDGKVLKLVGSNFTPRPNDVVVNWGNTDTPLKTLNPASMLRNASNKLKFFQLMKEKGYASVIPPFWTRHQDIPDDAFPIVCRTQLAGHSGAGIVIADTRDALVPAPLYVKYIKKEQEYRVHVGKNREGTGYVVIAAQRKARKHDVPDASVNWKVRNLAGGFVYVREGFTLPSAARDAAFNALGASGLDFGAVDIIHNGKKGACYVLEINTAPGLEGQTVGDYARYFKTRSSG